MSPCLCTSNLNPNERNTQFGDGPTFCPVLPKVHIFIVHSHPRQLYRCYLIWGSRKRILFVPGILIIATVGELTISFTGVIYSDVCTVVSCITGLGFYGLIKLNIYIDPRVPFSMGGATNILLMCLTGTAAHLIGSSY